VNAWFLSAAGAAALICAIHVVAGGREAVRPLLASTEINRSAKYTHYYCWHLVTITIAALAAAFAYASRSGASSDLAVLATSMSFLFALLNVIQIAIFRLPMKEFGQWILFLGLGLLGIAGLLT